MQGADTVAADVDTFRRPPRRVLVALSITQITGWGVLYYAFPVALADITADTGWSAAETTAAFSAGLIVSAIAGIPVGRWIDHYGPRRVMTGGSLVAVPATVGIALAPTYAWFVIAWLVAGTAMSAVFYQAAFAALTRWYGPGRVRALTTLTLVAGLASTVFAPLTSQLLEHFDWRETYLLLAVVLAVVTVPLHAFALTPPWTSTRSEALDGSPVVHRRVPAEVRTPGFLLLSGALTVTAFGLYAASLTLIPLLMDRGFSGPLAATTLGLLGAGQLLGRIGYGPLAARTTPTARAVTIVLASAATIGLLAALPGPTALLIVAAVLAGAARGAGTLLQATAVADRWGSARYGTLSGFFSAPITAAAALAPWAGTALAGLTGGYPSLFWLLTCLVVMAAIAAAFSSRPSPHAATRGATHRL